MSTFPHTLDRTIVIRAPQDVVFSFFTTDDRWAAWWGAGSSIEARPGGRVTIRHPGGIEAGGEVLEIAAPDRIVFTYGFASGQPMPVGASRVTIRLSPQGDATRLVLLHEFDDVAARDHHVQGWRYQLSLFANAVSDVVHAKADAAIDAWFDAWAAAPDAIGAALAAIAVPGIRFRDRFSAVEGLSDLTPHVEATQRFMPGFRLRRAGGVRQCQGMALAQWTAFGPDGQPKASGTNVFVFDSAGRLEAVSGFWA